MEDTVVFAEEVFGFHAQQAIEKALKARLSLAGIEYPKTHDISLLLSILAKCGVITEDYTDLLEFNPYAVQLRYEAFDEIGKPLDRAAVIRRVTEVVESTQQIINNYLRSDGQ